MTANLRCKRCVIIHSLRKYSVCLVWHAVLWFSYIRRLAFHRTNGRIQSCYRYPPMQGLFGRLSLVEKKSGLSAYSALCFNSLYLFTRHFFNEYQTLESSRSSDEKPASSTSNRNPDQRDVYPAALASEEFCSEHLIAHILLWDISLDTLGCCHVLPERY